MSLLDCTAVELAAKIKAGEHSRSCRLTAKSLKMFNCYVTFDKEKALQAAAKADEDIALTSLTLAGVLLLRIICTKHYNNMFFQGRKFTGPLAGVLCLRIICANIFFSFVPT